MRLFLALIRYWSFAAIFLALPSSAQAVAEQEVIAVEVTINWVRLIDDEEYAAAYEELAEVFKKQITLKAWIDGLAEVRQPMGKVVKRKVKMAQYTTELPGAPPGEYVLIQFETQFENREEAVIETITPMNTGEKGWRVSGFYLK